MTVKNGGIGREREIERVCFIERDDGMHKPRMDSVVVTFARPAALDPIQV